MPRSALRADISFSANTHHALACGDVDRTPDLLASFIWGAGANEEMRLAVRSHVERLLEATPSLPRGEPRLGAAVEVAFGRARERSATSPPVLENRAALLALGILLGHRRIEDFVGQVMDERDWRRAAPFARTTRRGRHDWTKHFFVSAALTVLSAQAPSDAIGVFKEEMDAGGGSGFSFGDLMADRAGTTFALLAARDNTAARTLRREPARAIGRPVPVPAGKGAFWIELVRSWIMPGSVASAYVLYLGWIEAASREPCARPGRPADRPGIFGPVRSVSIGRGVL